MPQIPVMDLMTRQIPTVLENASIKDAAIALLEHDSAEVYVVNRGGVLKGVVPDYEILKARLCGTSQADPVSGLISHTLQTVSPSASAVAIAGLFRDGFRSSMAVVDHHGRLIGQIKRSELLWLLTTLDRIENAEPEANPAAPVPDSHIPGPNFLRQRRILGQQIAGSSARQDQARS